LRFRIWVKGLGFGVWGLEDPSNSLCWLSAKRFVEKAIVRIGGFTVYGLGFGV
jgi:hypothetical protein